jgi:hypothetical protein
LIGLIGRKLEFCNYLYLKHWCGKHWYLALLLCAASVEGTEYRPWFGNVYESRFSAAYTYQDYPHLQSNHRQLKHHSHDNFLHLGLGFSPKEYIDTEVELQIANTSNQPLFVEYGRLTARACLFNDIEGDWISLSTGASLTFVSNTALQNVSTPHQGEAELMLHAAAGKEFSKGPRWVWRPWGTIGFTIANHPYPGFHGLLALDRNLNFNCENTHLIRVFSTADYGTGSKNLRSAHDFSGYGPIAYRAIDVGAKYSYKFRLWGSLGIAYTYRVYAHNYPAQNQTITLSYCLPFSFF